MLVLLCPWPAHRGEGGTGDVVECHEVGGGGGGGRVGAASLRAAYTALAGPLSASISAELACTSSFASSIWTTPGGVASSSARSALRRASSAQR